SDHARESTLCSNEDVRAVIEQRYPLTPVPQQTAGPSRYYRMEGHPSRVGFISPVSHNFCESCNRVRVTVEGRLLLCLGNEHSVDLRPLLRERPGDLELLKKTLIQAMDIKPLRHHFYVRERVQIVRFMSMTGGQPARLTRVPREPFPSDSSKEVFMAGNEAQKAFVPLRIAVVTVSDPRTEANDESGQVLIASL